MPSPSSLSHLIEFTPAEIRIFSFDNNLKPWYVHLERLHNPSRIGGLFAAIVRLVDPIRRTASLDIGETELAHLPLPKKIPLPHLGKRMIVQCKREAYLEKAPLMSLAPLYRSRYLELRTFPHAWFPPENNKIKSLSHPSQKPELQKILSHFAEKYFSLTSLPSHSLSWQFTPMVNHLSHNTEHLTQALLHDFNLLSLQAHHNNSCEKGLVNPPPSPLSHLIAHALPHDTIVAFGNSHDLQNLHHELSPYPELSLASSHNILSLDTSDTLDEILAHSHPLSGNAHIHIDTISALTAIDVDSGTPIPSSPASLNQEALSLIPQLIHAQNLSGLIVIDPLSSQQKSHARHLVNALRSHMKPRHPLLASPHFDILGSTHGGLIEITRQRLHPPLPFLAQNIETKACHIIKNLSKQAILKPKSLLNHQPLSLPPSLIHTLNSKLSHATKILQKQYDGITLWQ